MSTRCAVLGSPITHSLSPALHRAAYGRLGLDWTYAAIDVPSTALGGFLEGLDETWRGLSLTMPLKREATDLVYSLDHWASVSGAANTILLDGDRRHGFNTDVPGAMGAIRERSDASVHTAVVLGGGATAASVLLALIELGARSTRLLVRDPARARETVEVVEAQSGACELSVGTLTDVRVLDADIVVSTVPTVAQTPALLAACRSVDTVFEVVYDPWPTPLAVAAQDTGQTLVSGLDLLAHQAVLQVELMTGHSVPVELVRAAGRAELTRRGHR